MYNNEVKKFDCSRGCVIERTETGELNTKYNRGCCKLKVYNWLEGINQEQYNELFEVRFKNIRKAIYMNTSGQTIKTGDLVVVESTSGHDVGIVTLEGAVIAAQLRSKRINPENLEFKKIYRRAKTYDIERWQEAINREHEVMIRSRQIAAELELDMKIGDVEFQGDGTKAIFYYIAVGRVDFRQLIKVFADEFRIRIEMKQIGARQEAGLIGGLGVCGRELCCSRYISNFQSITTAAARIQDLSLNPQKLAGQCGKLKCCLNYETSSYLDAQTRLPKVYNPLEFQDGLAFLMKTDILGEKMYFSYDQGSFAQLFALSGNEVRDIIKMNRHGIKPESLKVDVEDSSPDFISAVGDDSITRFDDRNKKKPRKNDNNRNQKSRPNSNQNPRVNPRQDSRQDSRPNSRQDSRPNSNQGQNSNQGPKQNSRPNSRGGAPQNSRPNQNPRLNSNPNQGSNQNHKTPNNPSNEDKKD